MKKCLSALLRLLLALALSIPGGVMTAPAWAVTPSGDPFCPGGVGLMPQFISKMEAALAADPNGVTKLKDCNATPAHVLQAFQQTDTGKEYKLQSVSQLPAFLRTLSKIEVDKTEVFYVSCLWKTAAGLQVKMQCDKRTVRPGEVVYGNPKTGELLLMSSCANPGVTSVPINVVAKCLEVRFPSMGTRTPIRFAYVGPKALPGECHEYELAGERQVRTSTPEECPDTYEVVRAGRKMKVVCTWDAVEVAVSEKLGVPSKVQNVSGSFYTRTEGTNVWRLPQQARAGMAAICWEIAPGQWVTIGVDEADYVNGVATITPDMVRTMRWQGR